MRLNTSPADQSVLCNNIPVRKIQNIAVYINGKVALLRIDSGCEGDCMREDECVRLDIPIKPLDDSDTRVPTQADGVSPLNIVGKVKFTAERDNLSFDYEGYVCNSLHAAILCGGAFMERNSIVQELKEKRIRVANKTYLMESSPLCPPQADIYIKPIIAKETIILAPGENYDFQLPEGFPLDNDYIVSPLTFKSPEASWYPYVAHTVGNNL